MTQQLAGKELGEFLKKARKKAGLTLRDVENISASLAPNDTLKINYAYLSKLERGLYERPSTEKLIVLAVIYGLDHRDLLTRVGVEARQRRKPGEILQAVSEFVASSMRELPAMATEMLSSAMPKGKKISVPSLSRMLEFLEEARRTSDSLGRVLWKCIALYKEGEKDKIALLETFLNQLTAPEWLKAADEQVEQLKKKLEAIRKKVSRRAKRRGVPRKSS